MSVVLPEFFQPTIPISGGPLATPPLRREKSARFLQILRRVHVEERINRLAADLHDRKIDDDTALLHGEAMHGANTLAQRFGQCIRQRDAPYADDGRPLP